MLADAKDFEDADRGPRGRRDFDDPEIDQHRVTAATPARAKFVEVS